MIERTSTWWRDAVIYQVYPRSFRDSNGDGIGDLRGVIEGLPYLSSLGIDAIWLSPFYKTPNKDGGYDVADPRDVDPMFGTLKDAEDLITSAHDAGLRVIFDIVPNHFSSEHIWFQKALNSLPGSSERARFHFFGGRGVDGNEPPNNWNSLFNGPSWSRVIEADGKPGQWYLHLFDSSQPDLNWDNPEVHEDFIKTLRFWLDRGVDGFRIDVAHGLAKDEILKDHRDPAGLTQALRLDLPGMSKEVRAGLLSDVPFFDREGVHAIYKDWRKVIDEYDGDRMTVAEAFVYPSSRQTRYVRPGELHQIFNFDFLATDWEASALREAAERSITEMNEIGASPTWALDNHDSPRLVSRVKDPAKARAFALFSQALPGSQYIYQGEELGLIDGELSPSDRQDPAFIRSGGDDIGSDGARVPLPWKADEKYFGFSAGGSWLPQMDSYKNYAMDVEEKDPASFLNLYRSSLALRKQHAGLGGDSGITWHEAPEGILYFSRAAGFVLLANTTDKSIEITLPKPAMILLQSQGGASLTGSVVTVPANTTLWLQQ